MSIRTRIALSGGAVIFVALLVFDFVLLGLFDRGQAGDLDRALASRARSASAALAEAPVPPSQPLAPIDLRQALNSAETFIEVFDAKGTPLSTTGMLGGAPPAVSLDALQQAARGRSPTNMTVDNLAMRVVVSPWSRGGQAGFVLAGQPAARLAQQRRGFAGLLFVSSAFILLAAGVASWWAAGRALKPLKAMARAADQIAETQDVSQRLPETRRRDEIARLTASFNRALQRVQEAQRHLMETVESQKRFVADASHELRTPLTTIRANAGFLLARPDVQPLDREAALEDIAAESERMGRLVDDLLALARADAGQRLELTPLDLRPVVEDVARRARRLHPTRDLRLVAPERPGAILLKGNADALAQLLWILVDNAVKHTQRGGLIEIELAFANGGAQLSVRDNGPGLPEGDLERIFERFVQADRARAAAGAGLGLAIARWIVEQHGGRIDAGNDPEHGAVFRVELPVATPPSPNS